MTKPPFRSSPASESFITILAPAKINLILRILDRRPDGYHNLWSVMQTVGLEDELTIRLAPTRSGIVLRCDDRALKADHSNLVYRAAAAVLQQTGNQIGLDIALTKRIPMGAGLGGGSSDAAATLVGLNRLLDLNWSAREMTEVGRTLGSDVPFFFQAPCAIVSGRGEQVQPVALAGSRWIVLVNPGFGVETKWAYQQLAATRSEFQPVEEAYVRMEQGRQLTWEELLATAQNDFEQPVFEVYPSLGDIKRRLLAEGAEVALLSGSGATVFGVFPAESRALKAGAAFQTDPTLKVFAVPACSGPLVPRG